MPVDLMALSAHKVYGPKGIGALYVRRSPDVVVSAQMHGGGHERGLRSGTLATHQIAAMGHAFALADEQMEDERAELERLRARFLDGLSELPGVHVHGHDSQRVPGILNLGFEDIDGESLILALRGWRFLQDPPVRRQPRSPPMSCRESGFRNPLPRVAALLVWPLHHRRGG